MEMEVGRRSHCYCGNSDCKLICSSEYLYARIARHIPGATDFKRTFAVVSCTACGQARVDPSPYWDHDPIDHYQEDLTSFYEPKREEHFSYARFLFEYISRYKKSGRVLDIGCGPGYCVEYARLHGYDAEGIEVNEQVCNFAQRRLGSGVHCALLEEFAAAHREMFDAAFMNHVLEHIADPVDFLRVAASVLKPDGVLLIAVPNFAGLPSRLMRSCWYGLEPGNHVWQFTRRSLPQLVRQAGLAVQEVDVRTVMDTDYHVFRPAGRLHAALMMTLFPLFEKVKMSDQVLAVASPFSPLGAR